MVDWTRFVPYPLHASIENTEKEDKNTNSLATNAHVVDHIPNVESGSNIVLQE